MGTGFKFLDGIITARHCVEDVMSLQIKGHTGEQLNNYRVFVFAQWIIDNPIGEIFREHNIIEYKSPEDNITIDDFYKTIGYACLYKGYGETVNEIDASDISISLFRHTYPNRLFGYSSDL